MFDLRDHPHTIPIFPYTTLFRSYAPVMAYTPHASRIVIGSLAALGGAALLCAPRTARADGGVAVSPSIMVSLSFGDRKSTRLNSSHVEISYAVFCLKKKINVCSN